ncbi:hypothetical protein LUZ60_013723 [Juncus effusus]|nr:hypothetical protein LUZ60_013723 [Juncus effusus]
MAEIEEVEMAAVETGDTVIEIHATRPTTEISEEENNSTAEIENFVQQRLNALPGKHFTSRCAPISRLPARFREAVKTYYEPILVSIGPYHHDKQELQAMEERKWWSLRDFLGRNDRVKFHDYFKEIRALELLARMYYSEIVYMPSNDFILMLILDGCFILEYFLKLEFQEIGALPFLTGWNISSLPTDMFLLENQVPLFVIHKLFDTNVGSSQPCKGPCPLLKLIFKYVTQHTIYNQMTLPKEPCSSFFHLLHFYRACMVAMSDLEVEQSKLALMNQSLSLGTETLSRLKSWFSWRQKRAEECDEEESLKGDESVEEESAEKNRAIKGGSKEGKRVIEEPSVTTRLRDIVIPCMSELCEAGVTFKRKKGARHMFDISFNNGIMEMPLMEINYAKKIIISNVVAFEQSQPFLVSTIFTSYLGFMDELVNTEKDVALLQQCGILDNFSRNAVETADFFNQDLAELNYNDHYFLDLYIKVRTYSDSTWHSTEQS